MIRKLLTTAAFIFILYASSFAGPFLTLGYDWEFYNPNANYNPQTDYVSYINADAGYLFDFGLQLGFRYDHMQFKDYAVNDQNASVLAVVPSIIIGYAHKFLDNRLLLSVNAIPGYAVSIRYRYNTTDYRTGSFVIAGSAALYYQVFGKFYAGIDAGYRYILPANYVQPFNFSLNLGGPFVGITLKHLF
jgi:hypothetical protein